MEKKVKPLKGNTTNNNGILSLYISFKNDSREWYAPFVFDYWNPFIPFAMSLWQNAMPGDQLMLSKLSLSHQTGYHRAAITQFYGDPKYGNPP